MIPEDLIACFVPWFIIASVISTSVLELSLTSFSLAHQPHSRNNLVKKIKVQTISFICLTLDGKQ